MASKSSATNNGVAIGMLMLASVIFALMQTARRASHKLLFGFMLIGCVFPIVDQLLARRLPRLRCDVRHLPAAGQAQDLDGVGDDRRGRAARGDAAAVLDRMDTINDNETDLSVQGRYHFWSVARVMATITRSWASGRLAFRLSTTNTIFSDGGYGRAPCRPQHVVRHSCRTRIRGIPDVLLDPAAGDPGRAAGRERPQRRWAIGAISSRSPPVSRPRWSPCWSGAASSRTTNVEILWHFIGLSFRSRTHHRPEQSR
jgi:hypothetical protein